MKWVNHLAVIPFILATFTDLFSILFLLLLQLTYFHRIKKESFLTGNKNDKFSLLIVGTTSLFFFLNAFVLELPFVLGPFHSQQALTALVSDLGAISGIGFFTLLLAIIGLALTWKNKKYYPIYFFILITIPTYIYNPQTIFYLSLITIFFATVGFIKMFERVWTLAMLKKLTFFILILGLLFSSLTYLDRIDQNEPFQNEVEILKWVKENIPKEKIIFSSPENSYFVRYFAERQPFYERHKKEHAVMRNNQTKIVLKSTYISTTFPILEKNNISIIYITPRIKLTYPKEQGLLFLLKNERFKLVHSHEGAEVWVFN